MAEAVAKTEAAPVGFEVVEAPAVDRRQREAPRRRLCLTGERLDRLEFALLEDLIHPAQTSRVSKSIRGSIQV